MSRDRRSLTDLHTIFTHEFLFIAARSASIDAEDAADELGEETHHTDRFVYCMTAMMFCAFALEAYLNHLGSIRFSDALWEHLERLSPEGKLDLIAKDLNFDVDKSSRPYQTFNDIIRFRNTLAHGKTYSSSKPIFVDDLDYALYEKPRWMMECTLVNAQRWVEDTKTMILDLHERAGIRVVALGTYGASEPRQWKIRVESES